MTKVRYEVENNSTQSGSSVLIVDAVFGLGGGLISTGPKGFDSTQNQPVDPVGRAHKRSADVNKGLRDGIERHIVAYEVDEQKGTAWRIQTLRVTDVSYIARGVLTESPLRGDWAPEIFKEMPIFGPWNCPDEPSELEQLRFVGVPATGMMGLPGEDLMKPTIMTVDVGVFRAYTVKYEGMLRTLIEGTFQLESLAWEQVKENSSKLPPI